MDFQHPFIIGNEIINDFEISKPVTQDQFRELILKVLTSGTTFRPNSYQRSKDLTTDNCESRSQNLYEVIVSVFGDGV